MLIVGMNAFDSGKTVVSQQLTRLFNSTGLNTEYFKPMSGHNYWLHFEHSQKCLEEGSLYSYDARKVRNLYSSRLSVEISNPVHRLYVPFKSIAPDQIVFSSLTLGDYDSVFALERITSINRKETKSVYLVAEDLIDTQTLILDSNTIKSLVNSGEKIKVNTLEEVKVYEQNHFNHAVSSCFDAIEENSDLAIIESFNDTVWPWSGIDHVDMVLAVRPGQLASYNPERFKKAVYLLDNSRDRIREITFRRVSEYLKPELSFELLPRDGIRDEDFKYLRDRILEKE